MKIHIKPKLFDNFSHCNYHNTNDLYYPIIKYSSNPLLNQTLFILSFSSSNEVIH
jgi:hypothetical protein